MKRIRLLILYIILFLVIIYASFLYILPKVFNSPRIINKIEKTILKKTGISSKLDNVKLITKPDLSLSIGAEKVYFAENNNEILTAKKLYISYDLKGFKIKKLNIDYIFINEKGFKNILNKNKNKKTSEFRIKTIPEIDINQAEIWAEKGINSTFITLNKVAVINQADNKTYCTFEAEIMSDLLMNLVNIGQKGYLYIDNNALYAKNMQIEIGTSDLKIDGKLIDDNKKVDFTIKGNSIPVYDIEKTLVYFQKLKKKDKVFWENFDNYSGLADIDMQIKETGIYGKCVLNSLSAKTVLFDVPVLFKKFAFNFNEKSIRAKSYGTLGGENVLLTFALDKLKSPEQTIQGSVSADLTDKIADKYIKDLTITGKLNAKVNYKIHNKQIFVDYLLKIDQNSDLKYKNTNLGLTDRTRSLSVNTLKETDKLHITHYDYSVLNETGTDNIILGDGLFIKKNGHFKPEYMTCRTKTQAPVSVIGSLKRYITGGYFSGDLKYDFNKKLATGIFTIKESHFKNFFIKEAQVNASSKIINIIAEGTYKKSPFNCAFEAKNEISDKIKIYKMFLFLDEFIIDKPKANTKKSSNIDIVQEAQEIDLDIDKWDIRLNKIKRNRIEITNILINGSLVNNIFKFSMPNANFAKGKLSANGKYNIQNQDAKIDFNAQNIDSNTVADVVFNLPNQIQGIANASLNANFKNGLNNIYATAKFSIKNGYLPQLGSTEFMIKKSRKIKRPIKFKVSDIVNIDIKNMKALSSDIEGKFLLDNYDLKNVKITSSQKYLSLLIEGNYNIVKENGALELLGKYNKEQVRRVKILFVPLSWILRFTFKPENTYEIYKKKLAEVPKIEANKEEECAFRVNVKGDLNKKDLFVELKNIE